MIGPAIIVTLLLIVAAVIVASLWREVTVIEARVEAAGLTAIDGPEIGSRVPARLRGADAVYLFLSDHCSACDDVVTRFDERDQAMPFPVWAVRVADQDAYGASRGEVLERLPAALPAIPDLEAARIVRDLAIRATPLAIAVRDGLVAAKGYVRGPDDVVEIARPLTSSDRVAGARA